MQTTLPLAPPTGFRKAIPLLVKLHVVVRQGARCATCLEPLGRVEGTEFDHVPALQLRCWDPVTKDTVPPANDIGSIFAKHEDCHAAKTFGAPGASKRGTDITEIARTKRISKAEIAFRQKILAKTEPDAVPEAQSKSPKKKWATRPFERRKDGSPPARGQR